MDNKTYKLVFDEEEKKILDCVEQGEWKTVKNVQEEVDLARTAASCYLKKMAEASHFEEKY